MAKKQQKQAKTIVFDSVLEEEVKKENPGKRNEFGLSVREQTWCNHYLTTLSKKEASILTGSPEHSASNIGSIMYSRPHVRKFVEDRLREEIGSAEENVKKIQNMRDVNVANYMSPVTVVKRDVIRKSLRVIIAELELEQEIDDELMMEFDLSPGETQQMLDAAKHRSKRISKMRIELRTNPAASRVVQGEEYLATELQLDISKVVADKECGIITSYANTPNGIKITMPNPLEAAQLLARINGSFEKDNLQSRPHIPTAIQVNIIPPRED